MSYFPMFIELKGRCCLVVGGGRIALRKVEALREFGAKLMVVAPIILPEIKKMEDVACYERCFEMEDLKGQALVVAATDNKEQNHQISQLCRKEMIPVNAVDQIEDCSFIFPAYQKEGEVVAAFSSGGQSPVITQYLKKQIGSVLTPHLGKLAAYLGSLREIMRQYTKTEKARKNIYQELLQLGLENGTIPSEKEWKDIMEKYKEIENIEKNKK